MSLTMRRFRLALLLMTAGGIAKGAGVVIYRLLHPPLLAKALLVYDPLAAKFAEAVLPLFFKRGIAPAGASTVYELLLVSAFAAECFTVGLLISEARRRIGRHRAAGILAGAESGRSSSPTRI